MSYKKMVVIFLDIMGYKNIKKFQDKYEIHRLFHEEVKIHEERQKKIDHVIYNRKIFAFSDCAYLFFYYKDGVEESRKDDANLIYISAFNVSLTVLRLMHRGYLVRGGVVYGDAYFDELSFFGPAVERSYQIESKSTHVPRLQLDQKIGKLMFDWDHDLDSKDHNLLSLYKSPPFLIEQEDNEYFVNPVYEIQRNEFVDIGIDHVDMTSVKEAITKKVKRDKQIHSNNRKIISQLDWIYDYLFQKDLLLNTDKATTMFASTNK